MFRIDHSTKADDLHGTGKDGYTEGSKATQVPASVATADALNSFQEEPANAVEKSGIALDKSNSAQLFQALMVQMDMMGLANAVDTGVNLTINGAACSPDIVVVVGSGAGGDDIAASTRGLWDFQLRTQDTATTGLNDVAYSEPEDKFVAVGSGGNIQYATATGASAGVTWSQGMAASSESFQSTCWSPATDLFFAAGTNGQIESSTDGETFAAEAAGSSYSGTFWAVREINGRVFATGDGSEIQERVNGTWVRRHNTGSLILEVVSWAPGVGYYAADNAGWHTSEDGVNWNVSASTPFGSTIPSEASPYSGLIPNPQNDPAGGVEVALSANGPVRVVDMDADISFVKRLARGWVVAQGSNLYMSRGLDMFVRPEDL